MADAMIAIAGFAATFVIAGFTLPVIASLRQYYGTLTSIGLSRNLWRNFDAVQLHGMVTGFLVLTIVFLWMIVYAAMLLRSSHLPLSVVAFQPGMAALWSAVATFAVFLVFRLVMFGQETRYLILTVIILWLTTYAALRLGRQHRLDHVAALLPGTAALWSTSTAFAAGLLFRLAMRGLNIGYLSLTVVLLWMIAFAVLRLHHSSPSCRVTVVESGSAALWSATGGFVAVSLFRLLSHPLVDAKATLVVACLVVPLAWGILKAAGWWHTDASWIDRFGLALGFCWCAVSWLTAAFLIYLYVTWGPSPHYQAYTWLTGPALPPRSLIGLCPGCFHRACFYSIIA
jgi:hypothetical protein